MMANTLRGTIVEEPELAGGVLQTLGTSPHDSPQRRLLPARGLDNRARRADRAVGEHDALADIMHQRQSLESSVANPMKQITYQQHAQTPEKRAEETECLGRLPALAILVAVAVRS